MKLIIKILAAPVVAGLAMFVNICGFLLQVSAYAFGLFGTVCGFFGIAVLLSGAVKNGIIVLTIAFLISPLGLPMLAAWILGLLQNLRYAIQDKVYG